MKKAILTDLPLIPEEYGTDYFFDANISAITAPVEILSEMAIVERKFINGLVRYYEPESVLEIGVSGGGGSVVLLDAISSFERATLTSIDIDELWYRDKTHKVGFVVEKTMSELSHAKWDLITGYDPASVLVASKREYDFAVIDTSHLHPMETLNFLTVLPLLRDGAIVVLHDISLSIAHDWGGSFAPRILWSSVVAEKLIPCNVYKPVKFDGSLGTAIYNIGAFQISKDTKKYIRNVFESLMIPWEVYPDSVDTVRTLISKHYDTELTELFCKAANYNKTWHKTGFVTYSEERVIKAYQKWLGKPVIFYGAGLNMQKTIDNFDQYGVPFDYPIWDINAEKIKSINGHTVTKPDFETVVSYGNVAVITIQNKHIYSSIRERLEDLGFIVMSVDGFTGLI